MRSARRPRSRRALSIDKDHSAYQGLVQAQIQLDDMQRALAIATEAAQLMPRSARALALVGLVLSCDSAQQRKARRVLEQALALRPRCIEAVLALAELDHNEGHHDDAVKRLKEQLVHDVSNAEFIYVKLGEISMKDKPSDAIDHFRAALAINQFSESARSRTHTRAQPPASQSNNSSNARSRSPSPLT
jgi:tetratricopeptide (TPR) repeat protein